MYGSQRYRYSAAECLRAAQEARDHFHRKVRLSMALSWLSLAREDEAVSTPTIPRADVPLPIAQKSGRFAAIPQLTVLTEPADKREVALQAS
jgi:hypothetical protein